MSTPVRQKVKTHMSTPVRQKVKTHMSTPVRQKVKTYMSTELLYLVMQRNKQKNYGHSVTVTLLDIQFFLTRYIIVPKKFYNYCKKS